MNQKSDNIKRLKNELLIKKFIKDLILEIIFLDFIESIHVILI